MGLVEELVGGEQRQIIFQVWQGTWIAPRDTDLDTISVITGGPFFLDDEQIGNRDLTWKAHICSVQALHELQHPKSR